MSGEILVLKRGLGYQTGTHQERSAGVGTAWERSVDLELVVAGQDWPAEALQIFEMR